MKQWDEGKAKEQRQESPFDLQAGLLSFIWLKRCTGCKKKKNYMEQPGFGLPSS